MPSSIGTYNIRRDIALRNPVFPSSTNHGISNPPDQSNTSPIQTSPYPTEPYSPGSARHRALEQAYLARNK